MAEEHLKRSKENSPVVQHATIAAPVPSPAPVMVVVDGIAENTPPVPLYGSTVSAVIVEAGHLPDTVTAITNQNGQVSFTLDNSGMSIGMIMTDPAGNYWSMATSSNETSYQIDCPLIANDGPYGWWQQLMGLSSYDATRGKGMKVGVIDTGVGPNPCLQNVIDLGSLINGVYDPTGGGDVDIHGSIVCGLIAAQPQQNGQYGGTASGATIFSIRVFPSDGGDANQGDVAQAIRMMVDEHQVDLINLSLASKIPSKIEEEAINYAYNKGVVCVCASGNTGTPVSYPAAYPEAISVGALGLNTWGPAGSVTQVLIPTDPTRINPAGYYIPMFSNFGSKLDCVAPAVGLISTFPDKYGINQAYGDLAGTSLASPMVVGFLCGQLAIDEQYQKLTGAARAAYVKPALVAACTSLGLPAELQGAGVPKIENTSINPLP
ncbi:S8 family serine peptidase [Pedobacter caeni]|nr:S8 family serine peptidase [Pedobacter caeni]